jgi:hypothetical protein
MGDPVDGFYIIVEGEVTLGTTTNSSKLKKRKYQTLAKISGGQVFGME